MEIFLPTTETGGGEKDKEHWETKAHISSATEKEQIIAFEDYFAKLSKKLKDIDDNSKIAEKTLNDAEANAKKTLKISEDTRALVIFGFFVLLLMVAGLVFGYWQLVYGDNKETSQQVFENGYKILDLEKNSGNSTKIINCTNISTYYWQFKDCISK